MLKQQQQQKKVKNFNKKLPVFCQFSGLKTEYILFIVGRATLWSHWGFTGMKHEVKNSCEDIQTPLSCHPITPCPVLPFSTRGSLEIPKTGASVKMRYKIVCYLSLPSLIHTWWNLGCYSVFILRHKLQSLGQLRALPGVMTGEKAGRGSAAGL